MTNIVYVVRISEVTTKKRLCFLPPTHFLPNNHSTKVLQAIKDGFDEKTHDEAYSQQQARLSQSRRNGLIGFGARGFSVHADAENLAGFPHKRRWAPIVVNGDTGPR